MILAAADDERQILDTFHRAASEFSHEKLNLFSSGREVIEACKFGIQRNRQTIPDLLFLDIRMESRRSGFEVLNFIRTNPEMKYVSVVVMSSSHARSDVIKSYECGANAYFSKPLSDVEIFDAFTKQIRYWSSSVRLPFHEPADDENITFSEEIGSPAWTINRIRSAILPSLLRDLNERVDDGLPADAAEILRGVLVRLSELFEFRFKSFGPRVVISIKRFAKVIDEWTRVTGKSSKSALLRARSLEHASKIRGEISVSLRSRLTTKRRGLDDFGYREELERVFFPLILEHGQIFQETQNSVVNLLNSYKD